MHLPTLAMGVAVFALPNPPGACALLSKPDDKNNKHDCSLVAYSIPPDGQHSFKQLHANIEAA
ncbi:hypothetical protein Trco_008409 [Trichoderma cornu-damae]|uniref:Uncharacterized protein n=1 Tax=Trichoderma cornu-damae TaxID=654480 RepID=A0A9P8TSS8_9HYPO|nr:hypothetical protein Trco_008409 [Trichoderma cornu-damae]